MTFLGLPPLRQLERDFQRSLIGEKTGLATLLGWRAYHTHDSRRSQAGFPDLVLVRRPRLLFVELKRDGKHPTPAQRAWLEELRACGQEAYCWHPSDWDEIQKLLL